MNIRTKLAGKSNAVLMEVDGDNGDQVVAIITCGKKEDITFKVAKAINEHNVSKQVTIVNKDKVVLTNQETLLVFANILTADYEKEARNYTLQVVATY